MFSKCTFIQRLENKCGFSLIEVLITSAIIGIVTAIVVVKYGAFNSSVLLKNHAYEIALTIREAQVFSVSTRGDSNSFRDGYGIYIDMNSGVSQELILFSDVTANSQYDSGSDIDVERLVLDSRFEIIDLCVTVGASSVRCVSSDGVRDISMSFRRPVFDPRFYADAVPGIVGTIQSATIIIAPVTDNTITREITVSSTGQISVQ